MNTAPLNPPGEIDKAKITPPEPRTTPQKTRNLASLRSTLGAAPPPQLPINWEDFNYPPCLHLIHFSIKELQDPYKSVVKKIHYSFLVLVYNSFINISSSIAQTIEGFSPIRIFYSIIHLVILGSLGLFTLYRGYRGVTCQPQLLAIYKIFQAWLSIVFLLCCFVNFTSINGWFRLQLLLENKLIVCAVLAMVEILLHVCNALLGLYCILIVDSVRSKDPKTVADKVQLSAHILYNPRFFYVFFDQDLSDV
eukprot:TRINITY_DN20361_c0_g1_i2.p1 TRINITY_DN20361_c0_g1~~TRINITY_DN20361_c0_g1_i2.p1  ORF type:complete len:251 (-),score=5.14 TRINITY_DN20361_c0_g1_i2:51-803(-)